MKVRTTNISRSKVEEDRDLDMSMVTFLHA